MIWTDNHRQQLRVQMEKYANGEKLSEILTGLQASIQVSSFLWQIVLYIGTHIICHKNDKLCIICWYKYFNTIKCICE